MAARATPASTLVFCIGSLTGPAVNISWGKSVTAMGTWPLPSCFRADKPQPVTAQNNMVTFHPPTADTKPRRWGKRGASGVWKTSLIIHFINDESWWLLTNENISKVGVELSEAL